MSPKTPQDPIPYPGLMQRFGRAVVAVAAGAALSKHSRVGGALVFAGLAWFAIRRDKKRETSLPLDDRKADLPSPQLLEGLCEPSNPFLDEEDLFEEKWEDIRTTLMPPPSLFSPPTQTIEPRPHSSLLESAPTFVEVEEIPVHPTFTERGAAIPDTVTIPTTPDPPLGLLANSLPPPPSAEPVLSPIAPPKELLRPLPPLIRPKAGLPTKIEPTKPTESLSPTPPPKRKSFLDWLRD